MSQKTVLRHFASVALFSVLFYLLIGQDAAPEWWSSHGLFLAFSVCLVVFNVWLSLFLPGNAAWLALIIGSRSRSRVMIRYRSILSGKASIWARSFYKWGTCPRCLAFWISLGISLVVNLAYWPSWQGALFLSLYAASLASLFVVLAMAKRALVH